VRIVRSLDADWRFIGADAQGAERPEFDDTTWRKVDVPHDWSIAGPFDQNNPTGGAGGFLPGGVGWYRKHLVLPEEYAGRRVFVEFDGIMANSEVWINGRSLGKRPNGYVSFRYDLTDALSFGDKQVNVLAVRADNSQQPASRWYTGAGIYRHARLIVTDPVHLDQWATLVSTPEVAQNWALVRVRTFVKNESDKDRAVSLRIMLMGPDARLVRQADTASQSVAPGKTAGFVQDLEVQKPSLWDLEKPHLYQAITRVVAGDKVVDEETTTFGIRRAEFRADTGFWLNGRNLKIKGVCLHHDGGAFGAAVPLRVWERRLQRLRQFGVNAVRTAHNPVAPEFLDLCDRLGFLVMDEFFDCWTAGKNRYDYHLFFNEWSKIDERDTIRRDRNHPSVILWSVGNEIRDTPKEELAKGILQGLVEVCHENDPTRPVTQALFRPNVSHDYDNGLADMLDVIGTNYRDQELLAAWRAKPTRKIIGTEQGHGRDIWLACRDNPQHAGQFLWTGIDYLGESRRWPTMCGAFGLFDRTMVPRPVAFERASWWSERPVVHAVRRISGRRSTSIDPGYEPAEAPQTQFCDWTPRNTEVHEEIVEVYSNCPQVELFLNDKSLGTKGRHADDSARTWQVAYEPGTLKAVGKDGAGQAVATHELRTAGKPARIVLTADRMSLSPAWDDVSCVEVRVVDDRGVLVPTAADLITFRITGPGVLAAVDSGSIASHEPFQASQRKAFQGRCVAMVKAAAASGRITLTATAAGLTEASVTLEAVSARGNPGDMLPISVLN
jgi:beta-galactosidase